MGLFDIDKTVQLRIVGPYGKRYIELENEFAEPFREEGFDFLLLRLYWAPPETVVLMTIGIGVISGVSTYLLTSLIDKIFKIKEDNVQKNITITFKLHVGDNYISLPDNKENLSKELEKLKEEAI